MADPRPDPDSDNNRRRRIDRGSTPGTPGWMRVLGILFAIALIALFVVLHLTGTLGAGVHR